MIVIVIGQDVSMLLLLVLALTAGLSAAAGVCLSRRNVGRSLPWERRPPRLSLGFFVLFSLSGAAGLTWAGEHFSHWGVLGVLTMLVAWFLPWLAVQARHNRGLVRGVKRRA